MVEAVGEGIDERLEAIERAGQVEAGVELVAPGALGSLDAAVELGPFWRQDEEGKATVLAGLLEGGPELGSSVHLDASDREGCLDEQLIEEGRGAGCRGAAGHEADGPLGHRGRRP